MRARMRGINERLLKMFYPLGKIQEKPKGASTPPPPHPLYVRGLKCISLRKENYGKGHDACYSQNVKGIDVQPVTPCSFSLRII